MENNYSNEDFDEEKEIEGIKKSIEDILSNHEVIISALVQDRGLLDTLSIRQLLEKSFLNGIGYGTIKTSIAYFERDKEPTPPEYYQILSKTEIIQDKLIKNAERRDELR